MKSVSKTKHYDNIVKIISRKKLGKSGIIANIILDIYTSAKRPSDYLQIKQEILKNKEVFPSASYKTYSDWRYTMIKHGILICMASFEEMQHENANHKASLFRFGPAIKKHVELALLEQKSICERIDEKTDFDDLNALENRMNERIELAATKEQLADLELKVLDIEANLENILLYVLPPDTDSRREIIRKFKFDKETCIQELNKEKERILKIVS